MTGICLFAPMAKGGTERAVGTRRLSGAGRILLVARRVIVATAGLAPGATVSTSPSMTGAVATPMAAVRRGTAIAIFDGRAGTFERDDVVIATKIGLPRCLQVWKRQYRYVISVRRNDTAADRWQGRCKQKRNNTPLQHCLFLIIM
jgi:hypothetical protein